MRSRRAPTSADVARLAGVSRAAVSVALSGRAGSTRISEQTRRRILAAAADIGYTPHPAASALRRQQSMVVLFVARPARLEPYEQAIPYLLSTEATSTLAAHGYLTLVVQPEELGDGPEGIAALIRRYRVGGVLLDSPRSAEDVRGVVDAGVPYVVLMRPVGDAAASVVVDPRPGMEAAVQHLVDLGHRTIGFIGHRGPHPVDLGRVDSFRSSVLTRGLSSAASAVQLVDDYSIGSGRLAARRLLATAAAPTAIVTSSDGLTLGVLRHLYEERLRVPDDVSVVSFDDAAVAGLYPPVTSIAQPFGEVARTAGRVLLRALESSIPPSGETRLATTLVVRSSTGPRSPRR